MHSSVRESIGHFGEIGKIDSITGIKVETSTTTRGRLIRTVQTTLKQLVIQQVRVNVAIEIAPCFAPKYIPDVPVRFETNRTPT